MSEKINYNKDLNKKRQQLYRLKRKLIETGNKNI